MKWRIQGHSDDIISVSNDGEVNEEFDAVSVPETNFTLSLEDREGVLISVSYERNGTWHIGVSALEESKPLSDKWSFTLHPSNDDYKNLLVVTAPEEAMLARL